MESHPWRNVPSTVPLQQSMDNHNVPALVDKSIVSNTKESLILNRAHDFPPVLAELGGPGSAHFTYTMPSNSINYIS